MQDIIKNSRVKRIAILNPYLQGGHVQIAETESVARFKQAANNLGITLEMFANSAELDDFNPDFAIAITYQEGKLTKYPTYVSLNIAISLIAEVPRFIRNILSCDGFLTVSSNVKQWLKHLCATHQKNFHLAHAAFSVPKTKFFPCDFKHASAMYVGTNWDGQRHANLFNLLNDGEYIKCYGPQNSWKNYPASLYGGEISFDGVSIFKTYRQHAAGLCLGHPIFDMEGIASSRLFEIAAASGLPICSNNTLTKSIYGDSVLYLDRSVSTEDLADQIITAVQWMRSNPKLAQDMAREAHHVFNEHASMEQYILNIIAMHEEVMHKNGYVTSQTNKHIKVVTSYIEDVSVIYPKICYLIIQESIGIDIKPTLQSLFNQTYANIEFINQ